MTTPAVIVDAVRTPMGKGKTDGALAGVHPVELLATTLRQLVERNGIEPGRIDDVLVGCVSQIGEQSGNVGRMASLAAGLPEPVPSVTIERKCGSSQQAAHFAAQGIMAGIYDITLVAGIESMSRIPLGSARIGQDPFGPSVQERYAHGLVPQGIGAELIAARWGLSREALDEYSARSHHRAAAAREEGRFDAEIVPVETDNGTISRDESIRPTTSVEKLAELQPAFRSEEMSRRYPEIGWHITAGNSSQITDGASALLVMSERTAERLGLTPMARFVGFDVVGDDPVKMLTGPIPATRRVLEKTGMSADDISHFEVNEAFAPVPLAWQKEIGVDDERLNPRGGAISLGHPVGCSGARLMTTLVHGLQQSGGRYGLQTMCEGGGMANATILERV